ncbi:MAG: DHHA1 domain-containing protein, partial [Vicinamibacterales bacterium]
MLGGVRVLEVIDQDSAEVVHVVETPLVVGSAVEGTIDWPRRFDHMQQHTGQHILSASYDHLFGVRTESFHLGAATATIDLAREVSPPEIRAAEDEANRVVWEDRAVTIRTATAEEAASLPLRKGSTRIGLLRLIDVDGFDLSACGGTHVARTGAIGIIATSGSEKFRRGTRIEFLCGRRALGRFREWRDAFAETMRHLSVTPPELAAGVERLQADARQLNRTVRALQAQLAVHDARALIDGGERISDRIVVAKALEGWDAAGLKTLAMAAAASAPTAVVALFSGSAPALVVVACGSDARIDASGLLKALIARFGGKGGGKPDLAQGGGLSATAEELVSAATHLLRS